ncbi:MAG: DHA2 family efflux MFS transporter permease subunit [Microthrixaceae bacterium]|nr:DHA2 family efflux MFS transporter permease subunit [Microthrixaceae bacterium]
MTPRSPWPALWALLIGLFMTLIDVTIVSLANPAIKAAFDPASDNLDNVVWVTSAYLLGLAVPLLVTGRLGDRFGPKRIYLLGLVVFTLGSLTSGLSVSLEMLIVARAVQGVGAALMTPQTMAVITRTFPPAIRGAAMGLWGATSGVGMIVGPLLGGVLVGALGWQWVFFINVPLGIVGFILASIFVPNLETHPHRFDLGGVALSALGLFLVAFGLQEAVHFEWGVIWGPISVWSLIVAGVAVMVLFVWWQSRTRSEPLVPLVLFRDRNFTLASLAIAAGSFTMTSMLLPYMFFLQLSRGVSPIGCALLMMPMAVIVIFCSPLVGRLLDRVDPRFVIVPAFFAFALGMGWYVVLIATGAPILMFLLPNVLLGLGNAGLWGPLAATATRNLAPRLAGAGSGVYNTTRTIGSVLGSASIAAIMQANIVANLPEDAGGAAPGAGFGQGQLPPGIAEQFATAMGQSLIVPAIVVGIGGVLGLFLHSPRRATNGLDALAWEAAKVAAPGAGAAGAAPARSDAAPSGAAPSGTAPSGAAHPGAAASARLVGDHASGDVAAEV